MKRVIGWFVCSLALALQVPVLAESGDDMNIGVQLYSVRDDLKDDFEGTLRALADMGFEGVEFAGDYGPYADKPESLKALLEGIGLEVAGAHVGPKDLRGEALQHNIDFHRTLGTPVLINAYDSRAWDDEGVFELAAELNALDEKLAPLGLRVGYHNHAKEFRDFQDSTYWDALAKNTRDGVVLQQDVGWTTHAGKNPVTYVREYPGRTYSTHYKVHKPLLSFDKRPFVGEGETDWPSLVVANREVGGTVWYVVEQEAYPGGMTPLQSAEASLRGLEKVITGLESVD